MTASPRRAAPRSAPVGLVAALAALALALAACSTKYGTPSPAAPVPTTTTIAGASTPAQTKASDLRGSATYLLVEHIYLLASATAGDVVAGKSGAPAGPVDDAHAALDANSHDLASLVDTAFGHGSGAGFYTLWAERVAGFEAYARAKGSGDTVAATSARAVVDAKSADLAHLLNTADIYLAVTTLTGTGIGDELTADNTPTYALIDAEASADAARWTDLTALAQQIQHTADIVASGAAKLNPDQFPGTPTGTAANLRASLTTLLVGHVELASAVIQAFAAGTDGAAVAAALEANTAQLHNAIASIYGDAAAIRFSSLWTRQTGALEDYAKARAAGDAAKAATAQAALSAFAKDVGAFFSDVTGSKIGADTMSSVFTAHVSAMTAIADAAASGSSTSASLTRVAAGQMPSPASTFAEAVSEQFPTTYLP